MSNRNLCLLAAALGFLAASVWCGQQTSHAHVRPRPVNSRVTIETGQGMTRSRSDVTPSGSVAVGQPPTGEVLSPEKTPAKEEDAAEGDWVPRPTRTAARKGESGSPTVPILRWAHFVESPPRGTPGLPREQIDRILAIWREALATRARLGPPPWEDAEFTVTALVNPQMNVIGRDLHVEAGPEQSAEWYLSLLDPAYADARRVMLTEALGAYQSEKARLEVELQRAVLALTKSEWEETSVAAYSVRDNSIAVLRTGEDPTIDAIALEVSGLVSRCIEDARAVTR